ncbi:RluA family pseudouridine synthase [bacterium]|nr:RluA family pseudouridine synthase [bacterium]
MLTFTITETDHCRRVESFLGSLLPDAPLAYLRKLIRGGHLTVNGLPASPDSLLVAGDTITLKESGRTRDLLTARRPSLDILFEDDRIVVVNKPPGLPVHRTAEDELTLVDVAEQFLTRRGTPAKLRPVNRLDRGTSGATILAKSATSAGIFGRFVKETGLGKLYLAVADGKLPTEGTIDAPLEGKEAQTHYRTLFQGKDAALLLVTPITGRMHQIRKHLALTGHPVRGDRRYRGTRLADYPGHCLHAFLVSFRHPVSGEEIVIHAPLPAPLLEHLHLLAGEFFLPLLNSLPSLSPP